MSGSNTNAAVTPKAKISLTSTGLCISENMQRADLNAFEQACDYIVRSKKPSVTLDLSRCTYMSSLFIGVLVDQVTQMKANGQSVVVQVSPEVGRFLQMAHLYHLISYKIVEPPLDNSRE